MTDETTATEPSRGSEEQGEQSAGGVERIGETGLVLRMQFPHTKVREDFLIAFRGWLQQYQQTAETSYLVQALVGEKLASAQGDDTSGYFFGLIPILAASTAPWWAADAAASSTVNSRPGTATYTMGRWLAYDAGRR